MGLFAKKTRQRTERIDILRSGKSFAASSGAILDQMTITCDKVKSIHALQLAESQFLRNAQLIRQNNGPEQMAVSWEQQAGVISYLISQIGNNGGQVTKTKSRTSKKVW